MNTLINPHSPSRKRITDWRKTCYVSEFLTKTEKEACLMGWLQELQKNKTTDFGKPSLKMVFRDSTGTMTFQIKNQTIIQQLSKLEKESVIALKVQNGSIRDLKILAEAKQPPVLPGKITEYSSLDLVIHRPYALRSEKMTSILKIQDRIFAAARNFFEKRKFYELRPPIIGPATDPGIRGANTGEFDFYGKKYKLTTSMILYKQMAICSLEKIYSFAPNVRLEEPEAKTTGRHLAEFCQIDVEQAFIDYYDAMNLGEELVIAIISDVINHCQKELTILERKLSIPTKPFEKITHLEAIKCLQSLGIKDLQFGQEIPWEAEKRLSEEYDQPFWIIDYPNGSRGFYDRKNPKKPDYLKDFDLMYPEGYGEAISGSEREFQYEFVKRKMIKQGLNLEEYHWYLEMLQRGVPPSAGFGLGVERLTRYICGLEKIWEATAFPKVPGIYSP
ncbi:MAG: hypothetical protein EU542_06090 [Promethearchaeota archaeon]|nr:MAG: hypothetical protein EU542_06090 [Candidatus Lokiarchaeota archaeon]